MNPPVFSLTQGHIPLLISIPHGGHFLPDSYAQRMTPAAALLADTDWHLVRLYDFAHALGASSVRANYSRYVIDLNRPPTGEALYPGQTTTSLCPTETFRGEPLYRDAGPDAAEVAQRLTTYWQPYHQALQDELNRLRALHGQVLLWEAHSIASVLPRLFEGALPQLNLGTHDGASCAKAVQDAVVDAAAGSAFTQVINGRFKGGHITRHYGRPQDGIHVVQLEMTQAVYMQEHWPFDYREDLALRVQPTLKNMLTAALAALPHASPATA